MMRLKWMLLLLLLWMPAGGASGLPTVAAKEPAGDRVFLWKVESSGAVVYLLGSLHLANPSLYPLPAEIEQAFQECGRLVVEVDSAKGDEALVKSLTLSQGVYPEGDALPKHLSKATREALKRYLAERGKPDSAFDRLRPWLLSLTITTLELQRQGFSSAYGIDKHFLKEAKKAGKPVEQLESFEFQIRLLAGMSDQQQDGFLRSSVSQVGRLKSLFLSMKSAWSRGDAEALNGIIFEGKDDPELATFYEEMFYKRNVSMADRVVEYLSQDRERSFVVVGAGHLVGDKGVVALLQQRGLQVRQVTRATGERSWPPVESFLKNIQRRAGLLSSLVKE